MEQQGLIVDGRYKLVEDLNADGGMGTIWVADDLQISKRRVAVKFPLERFRKDPEMLVRFEREADLAGQVGGPNVVQILARGKTSEDVPYFVMELLEGEDLADFIKTKAPCGLVIGQSIVAQLCRVTARIHNLNIVHRDIKAGNIFLTAEADGTYSVKLLDFGIAKQRLVPGAKSMTRDFVSIGSVSYMAPEQMVNTRTVGRPADLWAIGVVTYEMLTGRLPFEMNPDGTLAEFYVKVAGGNVPSATSVNPSLPSALDPWFTKALHPQPEQRFESAEKMSAALAKIVSRVPVVTTSFGNGVTIAKNAEPDYPVVADAPRLQLDAHTHVVKPRSSRSGWLIAAAGLVMLASGGGYLQNKEAEKQRVADEIAAAQKKAAREEAKRAAARVAATEARSWATDAEKARVDAASAEGHARLAALTKDTIDAAEYAAKAKTASARAAEAAKEAGLAEMRAGADLDAAKEASRASFDAEASANAAAEAASTAQFIAQNAALDAKNRTAEDGKRKAAETKRLEAEAAANAKAEAERRKSWYTPTEAQRTALIKAVKDADNAEIVAHRSLDGSKLSRFEEGTQLQESYKAVAALKKNNTYTQTQLLGWDADLFSVNYDNDRAKVHVTESWNASFWDIDTNLCKFRLPQRAIPQWIYLRLNSAGRWMVTDVKHDQHTKQEPIACNGN